MNQPPFSNLLREYPETRRALWWKHTFPVLLWLVYAVILAAFALLVVYPQIANTHQMIVAPTIWLIFTAAPFFLFKLYQKLLDHSFAGTILNVESLVNMNVNLVPDLEGNRLHYRYYTVLTVETVSGKTVVWKKKLQDPSALPPYEIGQRIVHLKGSEHLIILNDAGENSGVCPLCGVKSPEGSQTCTYCNRPLIAFGDTFGDTFKEKTFKETI